MIKSFISDLLEVISPGARAAIILMLFFLGIVTIGTVAVTREAQRLKKQHDLTHTANSRQAETGEMVWINPGKVTMGGVGEDAQPDELPLHDVKLSGFWIDRTDVTNEEFERFVSATGYVTTSEKPASIAETPGLPPEAIGKTGAWCFHQLKPGAPQQGPHDWLEWREGANWRHPEGPGSEIKGREKHPVVEVSYVDAQAFCQWAGKRLPTEAEWEYAARGGLTAEPYVWGHEFRPGGRWLANIWQGHFPDEQTSEDGFAGTSPVGSFPPNAYGLLDMAGNVWQLTSDWYRPDYYGTLAKNPLKEARQDPKGPSESFDPRDPDVPKKVARGGSFLSSENYNRGYRPSARFKIPPMTALPDVGFRCAKDGVRQ